MSKNVMILGASGMLGHKMMQVLSSRGCAVSGTVRDTNTNKYDIIREYPLISGVDAFKFDTVSNAIRRCNPDVVVNCIGIVKQLPEANDPMKSLFINSVLPHRLATYCSARGLKLIHISTDCVFDGKSKQSYVETDVPTADDIYGVTKFVGEINDEKNLTIRTSIIGREIVTQHGLVEWFLSHRGKTVNGYKKSVFSGVTTNQLAYTIGNIILSSYSFKALYIKDTGLMHLSSVPINKYELLNLINDELPEKDRVDIKHIDGEDVNRSLESYISKIIPTWRTMVSEMMHDITPYDEIRSKHV
jgi:dTDP-4-dehydrorhamnose reductase